MGSSKSTSFVPLEIQRRIDTCCQHFERQWKEGLSPQLEEFVAEVDENWRTELLRELLAIELLYRNGERGQALTDLQICEFHPTLIPQLLIQLQRLRGAGAADFNNLQATPQRPRDLSSTADHRSRQRRSRGLHIRCPHCSNPVELVSDTPYESIICSTCGSAFSLVGPEGHTEEAPVLQKLGRFAIVARLGVGGFGTVWKARDTELDRVVAVKIPRKGELNRAEVELFVREARTAAQLRHPNIVPVHEVGREGDTIFIVSDFVRGVPLSDWLTGDPPSFVTIAELTATIADALNYAHQQGVIHRDLKPSNVLIDEEGRPFVMDFGLAKREVGEITMTVDGQVLGTPAYMSPEQARGGSHWTDRRTDIYSLGVVLFRLLTGELPFRGNSQLQIHQRLTKDPPDPRSLNRFVPRDLATICLRCIEADPNRRYSTAKELADELKRFICGEPILSRPISNVERTYRWAKRNPLMATTAALVAFLAIAGPLAAFLIEQQRGRLEDLLTENNRLIDRYKGETQLADSKISELSRQLGLWEGRTNPWEFWPPHRDQRPRQNLIADVLDHSNASLATKLRKGAYGRKESALGYLGLAMLASADGSTTKASEYYEMARNELNALLRETPQDPRFALALAECHEQLSSLAANHDHQRAAKELEKARAIYRDLAARHKTTAAYQIDWLESELRLAMMAGFDSAGNNLARVDEISRSLTTSWPSNPDDLYVLACYLTEQEPVLFMPTTDQLQEGTRQKDDAPTD